MIREDTYWTLCRLLAAWIDGTAAGEVPPDFDALFQAADRHLLSAAACAALEAAGLLADCPPETAKRFQAAKLTAIRRTLLMDAEREKVLGALEEMGVWHAPLKGVIVNAVYPQYGVRQFADNDILFDAARWRDVRTHMRQAGYKVKSVRRGSHDVYQKPPVYNFELHRTLFSGSGTDDFLRVCAAYYGDVRGRLAKDEGNRFGYHFSDEDFYIYFLAHACKHYGGGGTGLRTLLDAYLYRRAKPALDGDYLAGELEKLGLTAFERDFRSLSDKLFGPAPCSALAADEAAMLDWLESSGVYGTVAHSVQIRLRQMQGGDGPATARTKAKYLFRRIFPGWDWYQVNAPFVFRHRWTVPFYWVIRLCRGVFIKGRRNLREVSEVYARREQ